MLARLDHAENFQTRARNVRLRGWARGGHAQCSRVSATPKTFRYGREPYA